MKPLSKEQREAIKEEVAFFRHHNADGEDALADAVDMALAAEAYWREAVKNTKMAVVWTNTSGESACPFCDVWVDEENHKPDCPWAQE